MVQAARISFLLLSIPRNHCINRRAAQAAHWPWFSGALLVSQLAKAPAAPHGCACVLLSNGSTKKLRLLQAFGRWKVVQNERLDVGKKRNVPMPAIAMQDQSAAGGGHRGSRVFSLPPVVTTGGLMDSATTSTTTPPLSPSASMSPLVRPPTQGGGPLSSHPTTPIDMPGAWVSSSDLPFQVESHANKSSTSLFAAPLNSFDTPPSSASPSVVGSAEPSRHDSFRTPIHPASASTQRRGSKGVRKLLSLSSLRNSFMGSRNSVAMSSPVVVPNATSEAHRERASLRASSANYPQGIKRSASRSTLSPSLDDSQNDLQAPLRKRQSGGWFRRKSQIFFFGQDGDLLDSVAETQSRPVTTYDGPGIIKDERWDPPRAQSYQANEAPKPYEASRSHEPPETYRSYTPPEAYSSDQTPEPYLTIPELPELEVDGGSLHAEDMFANIGR